MEKRDFHAFTLKATGRLRDLRSQVRICAAFDPKVTPEAERPELQAFVGLWDTGATGSVVNQRVVDACHLKPVSMRNVQGAYGGLTIKPAYLVNIQLPNGVGIPNVNVILGELSGFDALIGMDLITLGDFAITNQGGNTTFSFRFPSLHDIDYVRQAQAIQASKAQRAGGGGGSGVNPASRKKGRRR